MADQYLAHALASSVDVMERATRAAREMGHPHVDTEHLLFALCDQPGPAAFILRQAGITASAVRAHAIGVGPLANPPEQPEPTPRVRNILWRSYAARTLTGDARVGTEHMLLALLEDQHGCAAAALRACGVEPADVHRRLLRTLTSAA
jgi:ATP-dependent Clp protease ATP-binding subunit ClpC